MSHSLWSHGLQHTRLPCSSLSPSLLKLMSIASEMLSNHLILWHHLLSLIFSWIKVFSNESAFYIRWSFSFSFSISPSSEYSGVISLTWSPCCPRDSQESYLAPHLEVSILWCSTIFNGPTVSSIHDCQKNHSFDYMGLCHQSDISAFNVLSRFVIAFLPRNKFLLILWLQSSSTAILDPPN